MLQLSSMEMRRWQCIAPRMVCAGGYIICAFSTDMVRDLWQNHFVLQVRASESAEVN